MLEVGGEEMEKGEKKKGGIVCMARHHLPHLVCLSITAVCVLQTAEEFVLSATKLVESGLSLSAE